MKKYVEIGGELELVDIDSIGDDVDAGRGVLDTIKREAVMFSSQEQINTHISLGSETIRYIRVISLMISESEPSIKRGMISYGKTYLYKHLYESVKRMRECEILLVVENRFVREFMMSGIPCPVNFIDRKNKSIRLVRSTYGSLLYLADEMHLERDYAAELAIWTSIKKLFEEDDTVNEMLKGDDRFIENLMIYDKMERHIKNLCRDYEILM